MSSFTLQELSESKDLIAIQERTVKFQEVDAAGTIFFPRILEYFADNYNGLLEKAGLDVPRMLKERTLAAPLAHAEATFLHPLFFGDRVEVEIRRTRLGKTSVTIGHRLVKDGRTMAIGTTAHVFVDGKTFKKAEVPPELVGYLKPFQRDA